MKNFEDTEASQESQYSLPYHYIPTYDKGHFSQHLYWSWGFRYLGGIHLVLDTLHKKKFQSLVDIGCGDGRFLRDIKREFPGKRILGVDYSADAINLPKALNPDIDYICLDIGKKNLGNKKFDVATLIEVLEHIPLGRIDSFLNGISNLLSANGLLILTVPHRNKNVLAKHYQHFDSKSLTHVIKPYFNIEELIFFDKSSILNTIISNILGNNLFILNNQRILDSIYRFYRRHLFYCSEEKCGRIFMTCKKG